MLCIIKLAVREGFIKKYYVQKFYESDEYLKCIQAYYRKINNFVFKEDGIFGSKINLIANTKYFF